MRLSPSRQGAKRLAVASIAASAAAVLVAAVAPAAHAGQQAASGESKPGARIIGGTEVSSDAYPFMTALLTKGKGSALKRQFCGGSLISDTVVMTAAHCVTGMEAKDLQLVVGRTTLSNSKQGQVRNARPSEGEGDPGGITIHPRYLKGKEAYDIAFVELDKPVKGIVPIKLPTIGTDALIRPGAKAVVTGWGNTDTELTNYPDRLRQVKVPMLSHDECKVSYREYDRKVNVCAGVEGKDSCQGDSGGPLFRTVPGRQQPIQIGVVSYGEGCAAQGAPGVYTSVSSSKLWDTLSESPEGKSLKEKLRRVR
ncbi:S1 family peptidase [Streptomyces sp. NPDC127084]|uniref:S1 family peptidase n=1 Tax=Streptomyces sp. NPDC127084 TaxID=3347133 RepID=UPI00365829F4